MNLDEFSKTRMHVDEMDEFTSKHPWSASIMNKIFTKIWHGNNGGQTER
jgi:hypothetical protein